MSSMCVLNVEPRLKGHAHDIFPARTLRKVFLEIPKLDATGGIVSAVIESNNFNNLFSLGGRDAKLIDLE